MQIHQTCKPILDKLNEKLIDAIPGEEKPLFNAARYVLEGSGKRLRPMMVLLAGLDLSIDLELLFAPAISLEFIHNYSLIHDDLPCIDDDDFRRGRPTVHKAYSEAIAVLLGDFFLTHAIQIVAESSVHSDNQKVELIKLLTHYSGGRQLIEGQMLDLSMEGKVGHFYDLINIYMRKTSSLFCCSLEMAALLSRSPKKLRAPLQEVGQKIGLAFQVKNDFSGRNKDQEQDKFTIFALQGEKQARLLIDKNVQEAIELLTKSSYSFDHLIAYLKAIFGYEVQ